MFRILKHLVYLGHRSRWRWSSKGLLHPSYFFSFVVGMCPDFTMCLIWPMQNASTDEALVLRALQRVMSQRQPIVMCWHRCQDVVCREGSERSKPSLAWLRSWSPHCSRDIMEKLKTRAICIAARLGQAGCRNSTAWMLPWPPRVLAQTSSAS